MSSSTPRRRLLNGRSYSFDVSAPGRTGRHIVFAVWRAGHADQNYYMCSDVRFPGGPADPTTAPPPPPAENDGCSATYAAGSQWPGGYQSEVTVTAGNAPVKGWAVTFQFPDGQNIYQAWNADVTSSGGTWVARNVNYNGALAAGASTKFGIQGQWLGTHGAPALSCVATR